MQWASKKQSGFTIVELLIVVVVIAILAAITIVAYNGITNRAKQSGAQSLVEQNVKKILLAAADNSDQYPTSLAAAGITNTDGLQYSGGGSTFCLTGTNQNVSYYQSNTVTKPTAGACAGHGVNGVAAITNLITNPSFEGSTVPPWINEGSVNPTIVTGTGVDSGTKAIKLTKTAAGAAGNALYLDIPLTAGKTYTLSFTVIKSAGSGDYLVGLRDANASAYIVGTNTYSTPPSTKTRVTYTGTALTTGNGRLFMRSGTGAVNDAVIIDSLILTEGSTVYNYADGDSPNWAWTATPNSSTSTGPPL
jgi:type IV pilus assembly protein PilA